MLSRNLALIGLSAIIAGCATIKYGPAAKLPDSEVAIFKQYPHKGFMFNRRNFQLLYVDGVSVFAEFSEGGMGRKILPGIHSVGVKVDWGDVCLPLPPEGACFNACYSDIALRAEAGHIYDYDIEKSRDDIFVMVSDETGKIVSKGLCENCSFALCGTDQMKSINKRIGKETKEFEIQNKAE